MGLILKYSTMYQLIIGIGIPNSTNVREIKQIKKSLTIQMAVQIVTEVLVFTPYKTTTLTFRSLVST